jgi:hypothetical protein
MLDSDDLLGKDYLQRAADFVLEDDHVDIIPGCMRNFDAGAGETSAVCSHKLRSPERRAIRRRIELTAVRLVGLNRPPAPR